MLSFSYNIPNGGQYQLAIHCVFRNVQLSVMTFHKIFSLPSALYIVTMESDLFITNANIQKGDIKGC